MNEKIKQLALQAGISFTDYGSGEFFDENDIDVPNLEKFAELIVKECANLAKTKSDFIVEQAMKYAEDADEETSAKATAWQFLVLEQEIKQHFGVEE